MMRRGRSDSRRLATVLFTDMVGSTERAIELGDRAWQALLRRHHRAVREELRRYGGHEVDSAGDGFFATFTQPAQAVRCALAVRAAVRPLGLSVRSGIHTGEVEPIGPKVGGVAVHLAARVLSSAEPDEILVTSTVRDLVAGSELTFDDAGARRFKGFVDEWHVFRVMGPELAAPSQAGSEPPEDGIRQRRLVLALGGVIGAALVIGLAIVVGMTAQPPVAAAGPNTVVRIERDELVNVVPVARAPTALASDQGALWVASEAGTLTRIALSDLDAQVVGGVGIPTAVAAADGTVWVAQGYEGRVARVDGADAAVRDTQSLHARGIAADGSAVWITDDIADRVVRLSTETGREDGAVTLIPGSGPRGIDATGASVWVANERAGTLVEIDPSSLALIGHEIGLGSGPTDVAVGTEAIWVTSMDADVLYRVDPDAGQVTAEIETCDQPESVVTSEDGVWVACRAGRTVRRFAADGGFVVDVPVPGVPTALAIEGTSVWVALRGD